MSPIWLFAAAIAAPRGLDPGTQVRVDAVGRKDAFWRFRSEIEGLICVVGEPGLVRRRGAWWSGPVGCNDGQEYYFFQVRVTPGEFGNTPRASLPEPEPPVTELVSPPPAPPPSRYPAGVRVRIRAVSEADTSDTAKGLVGSTCRVVEPLAPSGESWWSGSLECGGTTQYFYQVAVDPVDSPRLRGEPVPAGTRVTVEDLSPLDRYWPDRARLVGRTCSVLTAPLLPTGEDWYAGRLLCGSDEWQLYQVAVSTPLNP